ncbi:MAG: hypothetical protein L0387_00905 [Acidobacteria bacterium]|nr:hypothetical protein [Acidobacteriota bacterium]
MSVRFKLPPEFQIGLTALLAAHVLGFLWIRNANIRYTGIALGLYWLLAVLYINWIARLAAARKDGGVAIDKEEEALLSLSIEEAKRRATSVLRDQRRFTVMVRPGVDDTLLKVLAPGLAQFFSEYESVRAVRGDLYLARNAISASSLKGGLIRIGTDIEHSEVVVKPGDEPVYVTDGTESADEELETYPSIYHHVLITDHTLYGDQG